MDEWFKFCMDHKVTGGDAYDLKKKMDKESAIPVPSLTISHNPKQRQTLAVLIGAGEDQITSVTYKGYKLKKTGKGSYEIKI